MKLSGYGLSLRSVNIETAELLRIWRNNPRILQQMEYQKVISPSMQKQWFESIQNKQFAYFIIYVNLIPIGMIHLSNINIDTKEAEAGLFIGDERYSGTGVALGASVLLLDYAFDSLGLKKIHAKVKEGNIVAEKYNSLLGFRMLEKFPSGFNHWTLENEHYLALKAKLQQLLAISFSA